jgi:hypothetical protein
MYTEIENETCVMSDPKTQNTTRLSDTHTSYRRTKPQLSTYSKLILSKKARWDHQIQL